MTVKDKIINQLLKENKYNLEGKEIVYNSNSIANSIGCNPKSVKRFKDELLQSNEITKVGNGERNNKIKFTNPSKYKYNYSYLVENIDVVKEKDLSDSELKVLGYLHYNYSKFGNPFKLGLEKIVNNVGISKNYETNSTIIEKLEELKLVQWTKGNWKEHIVGEFKLLYIDNETTPIEQETKDNELINNKDININDMEQYEERFKKMAVYCKNLENRIKELEESKKELTNEIAKINDRLNKMALVVKEIQTQNKQQNSLNEVKAIQQQHKQQKQQQQQVQESKKENNQISHDNTNFMIDIRKPKTDEQMLEDMRKRQEEINQQIQQ